MLALTLSADLQGVTDLEFLDDPTSPYIFSLKVQCTSCREVHGNIVTFTQYEEHEISGSRGEANFVFRCKLCKRESTASIRITGRKYTTADSGKAVKMAEIDNRGIEFIEFIADGVFKCLGEESGYKFPEVNLDDSEWFDYDEKAGEEVSITEVKWDFIKA